MLQPSLKGRFLTIASAAVVLFAAGCSRTASLESWQERLVQYSTNQHDGRMTFLSEPNALTGQHQFTVLGGASAHKSTDVTGVLLGRRSVEGRDWLIFLVGAIKKSAVDDIRLAMLSDDGGPRQWIVGQADGDALKQYRQFKDRAWRSRHPDRSEPPWNAMSFPTEDDVFDLEVAGGTITAMHAASGARWTLALNQSTQ